ncbi:MAG: ABC transporter ATP-binding protein [Thermoanaerobacterales bacterium]|nr:ABC transporter ATP-binding protein [Thermoanaerobacterales bacterium]
MSDAVVRADGVWKRFRLYHERNQSLKATIMRRGRARYEEFWALKDVSFEVPAGSTFALIGHNGSGKSTMLKTLARILRPDKGTVEVKGKMSALLELGAGFHPELSGRENVYLNGAILGLSKRELDRRFDDIVGFAGLERFIDSPVKNYSSGMYVRLGFSVAINVDPDVLLIDEVLAVGDEEFQRKCLERVADLRASGRTIVVVTHSMQTVRSLCDRAVWLENGVVREEGEAGEVADAYLGQVQVDIQQAEAADPSSRWSQLRITQVELLDSRGRPTTRVATGDAVTFRMHYEAAEPVRNPVFSFAITTPDGMLVTGPNTKEAEVFVDKVEGEGTVDLHVPRLLLLLGNYDVTVECTNDSVTHSYHRWSRALRFDVVPGVPHETYGGVVSLDGRFSIN